jgi:hypothetical protein
MKSEELFFNYVCRVFHFKCIPATYEPLHVHNNKTIGNIEFLQLYPIFAAGAMLEIGGPIISDVL